MTSAGLHVSDRTLWSAGPLAWVHIDRTSNSLSCGGQTSPQLRLGKSTPGSRIRMARTSDRDPHRGSRQLNSGTNHTTSSHAGVVSSLTKKKGEAWTRRGPTSWDSFAFPTQAPSCRGCVGCCCSAAEVPAATFVILPRPLSLASVVAAVSFRSSRCLVCGWRRSLHGRHRHRAGRTNWICAASTKHFAQWRQQPKPSDRTARGLPRLRPDRSL